jgi:hypothetical protein
MRVSDVISTTRLSSGPPPPLTFSVSLTHGFLKRLHIAKPPAGAKGCLATLVSTSVSDAGIGLDEVFTGVLLGTRTKFEAFRFRSFPD